MVALTSDMIPIAAPPVAWMIAAPAAASPVLKVVPNLAAAPTPFTSEELSLGSLSASNTVVEYLSVTCSHCAAFDADTWPQVEHELVATGRVRFIIREMPTAPTTVAAAGFLLARCTGEGGYWAAVRALLAQQGAVLAASTLNTAIAAEAHIVGLDPGRTASCLSDDDAVSRINGRRQAGLEAGVDSTPFFIVNGRPLRPGARLDGQTYQGGELTYRQLLAAMRATP